MGVYLPLCLRLSPRQMAWRGLLASPLLGWAALLAFRLLPFYTTAASEPLFLYPYPWAAWTLAGPVLCAMTHGLFFAWSLLLRRLGGWWAVSRALAALALALASLGFVALCVIADKANEGDDKQFTLASGFYVLLLVSLGSVAAALLLLVSARRLPFDPLGEDSAAAAAAAKAHAPIRRELSDDSLYRDRPQRREGPGGTPVVAGAATAADPASGESAPPPRSPQKGRRASTRHRRLESDAFDGGGGGGVGDDDEAEVDAIELAEEPFMDGPDLGASILDAESDALSDASFQEVEFSRGDSGRSQRRAASPAAAATAAAGKGRGGCKVKVWVGCTLTASVVVLAAFFLLLVAPPRCGGVSAGGLEPPAGTRVRLYGSAGGARSMCLASPDAGNFSHPDAVLFVGSRAPGRVYARLLSEGGAGADAPFAVVQDGLDKPNGVAFSPDGSLFVVEATRIRRCAGVLDQMRAAGFGGGLAGSGSPDLSAGVECPVWRDDMPPTGPHHRWKYARFGPDGRLYVTVGTPCNACPRSDLPEGTVLAYNTSAGASAPPAVFATGLRNSVGLDFDAAADGAAWITDNGRDWLGDDTPPDELNHAPVDGLDFGFPYCGGAGVADPQFGDPARPCSGFVSPRAELPAHGAALGVRFYQPAAADDAALLPGLARGSLLVAERGSWNRRAVSGAQVEAFVVSDTRDEVLARSLFLGGFRDESGSAFGSARPCGRPVDVEVLPGGEVLVSDDFNSAVWVIEAEG